MASRRAPRNNSRLLLRWLEIFARAFSEAWARLEVRPQFFFGFLVIATMLGGFALAAPSSWATADYSATTNVLVIELLALAVILQYFVIADAIRAVVPSFRLTVLLFVLLALVNAGYSIIVEVGIFLLIVPGFYLAVKLSLWVPYLLFGNSDAFTDSFSDTTGAFWETALLNFLAWAVCSIGLYAVYALVFIFAEVWRASAVIVAPVATAAGLYLCTAVWLMWVHWADALLQRRSGRSQSPASQ